MIRYSLISKPLPYRRLRVSFLTIMIAKQYIRILSIIILLAFSVLIFVFPGFCEDPVKNQKNHLRKMTLADAVFVALTNDVTLRSRYLDRYLERITLQEVERQYYLPSDPSLALSLRRGSNFTAPNTDSSVRTDYLIGTGNFTATLAFQFRTDYLQNIKNIESLKLKLTTAKRNMLWQLDFKAATNDGASATTFDTYDATTRRAFRNEHERDWYVGLDLTIPIVYYMTSDIKKLSDDKKRFGEG